jgi:outer membrane autotransporter protein
MGVGRQLLLSTTMLVGALVGYGRRAYGACVVIVSPNYLCSGVNAVTQTITANNAAVTTDGTFSVNAAAGNALTITGAGDISYTDANASTLDAASIALYIQSTGDDGLTPGSVTVDTDGTIKGAAYGIYALNNSTGALSVTANGNVTATNFFADGIYARNYGTDLTVTTGAGTTVTGADSSIFARNLGTGALTITANGDLAGAGGMVALNYGTALSVTTGAGAAVTGVYNGIIAFNFGSGALTVTANGDLTGTNTVGIFLINTGTDLTVTTAGGSAVTGGIFGGIYAINSGSGALTIAVDGDVTGTNADGIYALHGGGGPIDITVGATASVISNGAGADDFAIQIAGGPGDVTLSGTLNGGAGGAVQFDQVAALNDRLTLDPSYAMNGNAFGGPGIDNLTLRGAAAASFDVAKLIDFETGDKTGSGHWTLNGNSVDALDFTVSGGILTAGDAMANLNAPDWAFNVTSARLDGIGTIGALTAGGGGVVAPGNSIGTLTVNGNLTLGAGSTFEVELDATPNNSDRIIVTGNGIVNLTGAALQVLAANGAFGQSTSYTIIDNDGDGTDPVIGQFASVSINLPFLTPVVLYDANDGNDVVLTLLMTVPPPPRPGGIHASVAGILADESRYVREAIWNRLMQATYTDNAGKIASLGASGPQVASLDAQAMALGYDDKSLAAAPAYGPSLAFWTRAYGAWADFDGDKNAFPAERDLGGFLSGVDARVSGTWRAGLAAGFAQSGISVAAQHSAADVESFNLAGYAGGMAGPFSIRTGGAWAFQEIDTTRVTVAPGFFARDKASYDADTRQIFGEAAYPMPMGSAALEPFAGFAFVSVETDSFKERGGALTALTSRGTGFDVEYSTLGLRAATTMAWNSVTVTPHASAAWLHAFGEVTPDAALAFASSGVGFVTFGVPLAENSLLVEAGLDLNLSPTATLGVSYSGQLAEDLQDNAVKGRFTWLF